MRHDFAIHGPFWSQAHRAFRLEYEEREDDVPVWSSSFWCEHQSDADMLAKEAHHTVKDRAGWQRLHNKARTIAASSNGFLYRTIIGQPAETYRRLAVKPKMLTPYEEYRKRLVEKGIVKA